MRQQCCQTKGFFRLQSETFGVDHERTTPMVFLCVCEELESVRGVTAVNLRPVLMATLHGLLPPASQLLSSIYLFSRLSPRTGGSPPRLAGSQVGSATPDQAAPHTNSGLTSIHSEPQQNSVATAFYFTITHAWTFCSCCLQVLHP